MNRIIAIICLFSVLLAMNGCFRPEDKAEQDMKSKDPSVRRETAIQLGEMGTPQALKILELSAEDPDFQVRDAVRASIRKINAQIFMK